MQEPRPPHKIMCFWDIENMPMQDQRRPQALVGAVEEYLRKRDILRRADRLEFFASHNPRLGNRFCLSEREVDALNVSGVKLLDQGGKPGRGDAAIIKGVSNAIEDHERYGLRVGAIIVISSDSDFAACDVYDRCVRAGLFLLVVHRQIKPALKATEHATKQFVNIEDLFIEADSAGTGDVHPPPPRSFGSGGPPAQASVASYGSSGGGGGTKRPGAPSATSSAPAYFSVPGAAYVSSASQQQQQRKRPAHRGGAGPTAQDAWASASMGAPPPPPAPPPPAEEPWRTVSGGGGGGKRSGSADAAPIRIGPALHAREGERFVMVSSLPDEFSAIEVCVGAQVVAAFSPCCIPSRVPCSTSMFSSFGYMEGGKKNPRIVEPRDLRRLGIQRKAFMLSFLPSDQLDSELLRM